MHCTVFPAPGGQAGPQQLPPNYDPTGNSTTCGQVQNIRVNVHFLQHDDGTGNFTTTDDGRPGNPGTATTGYNYAQGLIWACNGQMDQNSVLRLAPGSSLTPVPKRVRWVLDGVYFDRNSTYRNGAYNLSRNPPLTGRNYDPLCVRADSVINIFLVEEEVWPYDGSSAVPTPVTRGYVMQQARCDTYPAPAKLWTAISSPWTKYILAGTAAWEMASTVNHELGHLLGLNHPFQSASFNWGVCSDAPASANCWNLNEPPGPDCNAWSKISNNLMDYNADQSSLSPCQIGIIHNNLNTCLRSRFVYKCSDCMPPLATFDLSVEAGCMPAAIWLDGRAAWNNNSFGIEIDQVNAASPTVPLPGTHYQDYNWSRGVGRERLDAVYPFAANRTYRVKLTVLTPDGCATARQVRTFTTPPCVRMPDPQRTALPPAGTASSSSTPSFPKRP